MRGNLIMLRKLGLRVKEELGLEDWFPPLGTYPLNNSVGMEVVCVALSVYRIKKIYFGHM